MPDGWTAKRIRLLKKLWAAGLTAAAIATRLGGGLSRSSVLGKIYRLRHRGKARGALKARPKRPRTKQSEPAPDAPRTKPKSLLELTNDCCRFPIVDPGVREIFFCGAPQADMAGGMPYCPYHARRAYVIPPRRIAATKLTAAAAAEPSAVAAAARRYVWRAPVRHPAPRLR